MSFLKKIAGLLLSKPAAQKATAAQQNFNTAELTSTEEKYCADAQLSEEYGLLLKRLTNSPVEKLEFESLGEEEIEKPAGIYCLTSEDTARHIISDHQERVLNEGNFLFITDMGYKGAYIGIVANITDPYQLMKIAGTNGSNYDIETEDIIEKYKKWDQQFGIRTIGIGFDFCECEIINKDIDYKKLAGEVYEFCPDTVEQGTETVEALEEELIETGIIYLWWD